MNTGKKIVEVKQAFRGKVARRAGKPGGRGKLVDSLNVSYATVARIIKPGRVRLDTLELFVRALEGPYANVQDFITTDHHELEV